MKIGLMFFVAFLGGFANAMFAVGQRKASYTRIWCLGVER